MKCIWWVRNYSIQYFILDSDSQLPTTISFLQKNLSICQETKEHDLTGSVILLQNHNRFMKSFVRNFREQSNQRHGRQVAKRHLTLYHHRSWVLDYGPFNIGAQKIQLICTLSWINRVLLVSWRISLRSWLMMPIVLLWLVQALMVPRSLNWWMYPQNIMPLLEQLFQISAFPLIVWMRSKSSPFLPLTLTSLELMKWKLQYKHLKS